MIKILVLRFSAMGDVALLVPVIRSAVAAHPDLEITVATRPRFAPFFHGIDRVEVFSTDLNRNYKGFFGMGYLFRDLTRTSSYDYVIDAHDHLRTKILRTLFRLSSAHVIVFRKGRPEKKKFARRTNKITRPLPHTVERYQEAFTRAGLTFSLTGTPYFHRADDSEAVVEEWLNKLHLNKTGEVKWIGLAPFAMHRSKIWPLENHPRLIECVLEKMEARFFLFGGGSGEIEFFNRIHKQFPTTSVIVAGQLRLQEEIALMSRLDLMVCVDSSNMHLAALSGLPTLSVWGGTHPDVGFAPFGNKDTIVQISRDELPCRPCSVYGREDCYVGGFPCLTRISPELVAGQVARRLGK